MGGQLPAYPPGAAALASINKHFTLAQLQAGDAVRGVFPMSGGLPAGCVIVAGEFDYPYAFSNGTVANDGIQVAGPIIAGPRRVSESNSFPILSQPSSPCRLLVSFSKQWDGGDVTITGKDESNADQSETVTGVNFPVLTAKVWKSITAISKGGGGAATNDQCMIACPLAGGTPGEATLTASANPNYRGGSTGLPTPSGPCNLIRWAAPTVNVFIQIYTDSNYIDPTGFAGLTRGLAPADADFVLDVILHYTPAPTA